MRTLYKASLTATVVISVDYEHEESIKLFTLSSIKEHEIDRLDTEDIQLVPILKEEDIPAEWKERLVYNDNSHDDDLTASEILIQNDIELKRKEQMMATPEYKEFLELQSKQKRFNELKNKFAILNS